MKKLLAVAATVSLLALMILLFVDRKEQKANGVAKEQIGILALAPVHESPNVSSKILGTVEKGETYDVLEKFGDSVKVDWQNELKGWVYFGMLKQDRESKIVTVKQTCSVYKEPGKDKTKIVGTLEAGTVVDIVEVKPTWYRISRGWVSEKYSAKVVIDPKAKK